jgi:integrase
MSATTMTLVDHATQYVAERRALGFALHITGKRLLAFARYADEHFPQHPLTTPVAVAWARSARRPSPMTWARRLEIIRPFARYLRRYDPATEVPAVGLLGRAHRRLAPHVYTGDEVGRVLREAGRLSPPQSLRAAAVTTVLGLLAAAGLRVSEALRLGTEDVDLVTGVLHIRLTKFCKSRFVPLHPTAVAALGRYATERDRRLTPRPGPFFIVDTGRPLTYSKLRTAFQRIRARLGWDRPRPARRPRLHDLRHTFACRRLLQWHRDGVDVEARLIDLSTYLGHAKVSDTYWYLSGFPELLQVVGQRFDQFAGARESGR